MVVEGGGRLLGARETEVVSEGEDFEKNVEALFPVSVFCIFLSPCPCVLL